jgi:hypothetical protein
MGCNSFCKLVALDFLNFFAKTSSIKSAKTSFMEIKKTKAHKKVPY